MGAIILEETAEEIVIHLPKKNYTRGFAERVLDKIELENAIEAIDFDDSIFDLAKDMKTSAWERLKPLVLNRTK